MKNKILNAEIDKEERFGRFARHEAIDHSKRFEDIDDIYQYEKRHVHD